MSRYFVPLQQPQVRNALIDFSPINAGLDSIRDQRNTNTRNAMMQQQMDAQKEQQQWARGRAEKQDELAMKDRAGKAAMTVAQMDDNDPAKAMAWQRLLKEYGDGNHSPEELDFRKGPKLLMAASGLRIDPMDARMQQAKLGLIQAQTAQANQRAEPDPIKQFVADKLRRVQQSAQAPAAPQVGGVQKQSFDGSNGIPGLQLAADGQTAQPMQPATPDMVDTPFGKMGRNEARDLGSTLLLDPRYATAGKAILDSIEGPNQGQMGKTAQNQIEEKTLNNAAMLARLGDIGKRFDPKFLEIPTRMKMLGASWSAKAGAQLGGKLSTEQQGELSRFASFKSASVNNLNTILKELSGAAVTPQEYERLKNDVPQAGTGIFDGDDPVSFKAKLDRAQQTARAAIARYNFMRSKGLNFDRNSLDQFLSLDDVPAAIDKRGAEIEGQLRKSGADPRTIDQQVRRKLKQEFGI